MAAKAKTAPAEAPYTDGLPYGGVIDLPAPDRMNAAKASKPAKIKTSKKRTSQSRQEMKKNKKSRVGLIAAIAVAGVVALAVAFAVLVAAVDLFGLREGAILAVVGLDPEFVALETRQTELDGRESAITSREADLELAQARLNTELKELELREQELYSAAGALVPLYRQPMSPQDLADMQALAATYQAMSPSSAADILSRLYTTDDVAAILYYMTGKATAAVLSEMEPELAAEITEVLLSKPPTVSG
jgi:flagellar motility protein MotE (MotC chaperone)